MIILRNFLYYFYEEYKSCKKNINVSYEKLSKVFSKLISLKYLLIYLSINKTKLYFLRIFS